MARKKRKANNKDSGLIGLVALPFVALAALFDFLREHMWLTLFLAVAVIFLVKVSIDYKRKQHIRYMTTFYDRDRRTAEVGADEHLNEELTQQILTAGSNGRIIMLGENNTYFDRFKEAYLKMIQSSDIDGDSFYEDARKDSNLLKSVGLTYKRKPVILFLRGGFHFQVFPEAVLAFFQGPEKTIFLAAYHPTSLKIQAHQIEIVKPKVIHEKTRYDIREYDRFNPIPDAEIISSKWSVTNKDGSRSFKGGLLPENNPLLFTLRYITINLAIGNLRSSAAFSRYDKGEAFDKEFKQLKSQYASKYKLTQNEMRKEAERQTQKINSEQEPAGDKTEETGVPSLPEGLTISSAKSSDKLSSVFTSTGSLFLNQVVSGSTYEEQKDEILQGDLTL